MRMAVSTDGNTITRSKIVPTPQDFSQGILAFKQTANELSGAEKINGIAGGIAGPLDQEKTMLVASPHIGGWIQKPLKSELEKTFDTSVYLENDTVMGGIGEAVKGAGAGKKIVAYLAIGTGIGGARIVDQRVDSNSLGFEPGHQIIIPDGNPCNCGGKGHLESYVGGLYIEKIYHQKAEAITDPAIWDKIARYLAIGLNNTIVHWSPDVVVLGGSVMKSLPLEMVIDHLKNDLTIFPQAPEVALAILGHDSGFYGALELLK